MGLVVVSPMASVSTLITTPEAREQLASLAANFAWNADVVAVTTIGGYATWKIGVFIFLIAIWPLLAGSRMLRGEEDRGSLDVLLSLPRPRMRVAAEKLAAMWTALLAMGLLIGLVVFAGGRKFGGEFGLGDALLFGLNLALVCAVFGSLALLISQFTQERGPAAGWTAGLLLLFIVLDMVRRVVSNSEWISRVSPIYYYNLSKPLVPGYGVNAGAMVILLALAVFLGGAAVWLFARRGVDGRNAGFLSAMFFVLPLCLMAFAVTQVNGWSADEQDGRLELVLAAPQRRTWVLLGRFAALGTATVVIAVITLLASAAAAAAAGLNLDSGNLAAATLGMIPLGLLVAAIGYLAAGWLRTAADTGLLSFLLAAWFFISFIGPDLKWPDATLRLSPFYYYGTPLLHGVELANLAVVVGVGAVALALGSLRFARKDIGV